MSKDIQTIEKRIVRITILNILAAGFSISVNDGEEETLTNSTDPDAIFAAMFTTDEDSLLVGHNPSRPEFGHFAMVRFIYGNDGWDVINDYSTSLEKILKPVIDLADRIEEIGYAAILEEENAAMQWKIASMDVESRMLAGKLDAVREHVDAVRTHADAWIGLLAALVETLPPDTAPTPENPAGQCSRSYAEHELRAMQRDLSALVRNVMTT